MKIVINSLERIAGVEIFPIISLLIFFIFFVLVTYLIMRTSNEEIEEMSQLPLDKSEDHQSDSHSTF
jgi:cbb3-type cytochrome oxidase subunit 3